MSLVVVDHVVSCQEKKDTKQENDEEQGIDEEEENVEEEEEEENVEEYDNDAFVQFLDALIDEFDTRFSDFKEYDLAFKFLKNPFIFDQEKTQRLSDIFKTKKTHLDFDIALIQDETHLPNELSGALWSRLLSYCDFMVLKTIVPKFPCMFSSTYVCESKFSSLARRKTSSVVHYVIVV